MQHVWHALFNLQLCFCRSEVWKSNRFGIIFLWWHQKTKRHVKTPYSFWKLKIENFMLYTLWIHVIMKQLRLYQFGFWNLATFDICGNNDFLGIGYERPRSVVDYGGCCQLRTGAPPPPCSDRFQFEMKGGTVSHKTVHFFCSFHCRFIQRFFLWCFFISGMSYIACCHEQNQVQDVKHIIMCIPFLICMPLGFARPEPFCLHALSFEAVFRARLAGFIFELALCRWAKMFARRWLVSSSRLRAGGACSCYLQLVYLPEVLQIDVHPESDPTFGAHSPWQSGWIGLGCYPTEVHGLLTDIGSSGWSWSEVKAVATEVPQTDTKVE
jgi:hypothetical protein